MCTDFTCARTIVVEVSMSAFLAELQRNPAANVQIVPRRIPAAVQVDADRGRALEKILAVGIAAGNENRNRSFDTRASAQLNTRMDVGWRPEKSLAQKSAPPLRLGLIAGTRTRAITAAIAPRRTPVYSGHIRAKRLWNTRSI